LHEITTEFALASRDNAIKLVRVAATDYNSESRNL